MELGRRVEHDDRSWGFKAARAPELRSALHARRRKPLDQGSLGSCTGMAMAGLLNTRPFKHNYLSERTALRLYKWATRNDPFEGEYPPDDTGSSGLAVAKAAQRYKFITSYYHAFGLQHALEALTLTPVITGIPWYEGFFTPDSSGFIAISGDLVGGHEVEVLGIDVERKTVRCCNSWGTGWGDKGYFNMAWGLWDALLQDRGDVTVAAKIYA